MRVISSKILTIGLLGLWPNLIQAFFNQGLSGECRGLAPGYYVDQTLQCTGYFMCSYTSYQPLRFSCPEGTLFDETNSVCNHKNLVKCGQTKADDSENKIDRKDDETRNKSTRKQPKNSRNNNRKSKRFETQNWQSSSSTNSEKRIKGSASNSFSGLRARSILTIRPSYETTRPPFVREKKDEDFDVEKENIDNSKRPDSRNSKIQNKSQNIIKKPSKFIEAPKTTNSFHFFSAPKQQKVPETITSRQQNVPETKLVPPSPTSLKSTLKARTFDPIFDEAFVDTEDDGITKNMVESLKQMQAPSKKAALINPNIWEKTDETKKRKSSSTGKKKNFQLFYPSLLNPPKYNIVFENKRNKKSFQIIKEEKINSFHKNAFNKNKIPKNVYDKEADYKLFKNKSLNDTKKNNKSKILKNMKAPGKAAKFAFFSQEGNSENDTDENNVEMDNSKLDSDTAESKQISEEITVVFPIQPRGPKKGFFNENNLKQFNFPKRLSQLNEGTSAPQLEFGFQPIITDNRNPNRGMNVNPDSDIFTFSDKIGSDKFLREERNFVEKSGHARARQLFDDDIFEVGEDSHRNSYINSPLETLQAPPDGSSDGKQMKDTSATSIKRSSSSSNYNENKSIIDFLGIFDTRRFFYIPAKEEIAPAISSTGRRRSDPEKQPDGILTMLANLFNGR